MELADKFRLPAVSILDTPPELVRLPLARCSVKSPTSLYLIVPRVSEVTVVILEAVATLVISTLPVTLFRYTLPVVASRSIVPPDEEILRGTLEEPILLFEPLAVKVRSWLVILVVPVLVEAPKILPAKAVILILPAEALVEITPKGILPEVRSRLIAPVPELDEASTWVVAATSSELEAE